MSKLDDNGQPIYREDGKIMKSNNYFSARHRHHPGALIVKSLPKFQLSGTALVFNSGNVTNCCTDNFPAGAFLRIFKALIP